MEAQINIWIDNAKLRAKIAQEHDEEVTPMNSVSVVSKQHRTSASRAGSESAHSTMPAVSSAHLKEVANNAALEASLAMLKEKQAFELKEAELKAQKEELLLKTALAASNANRFHMLKPRLCTVKLCKMT